MVVLLDTHAKVRLSDGEPVHTGIKKLPSFLTPWMARFGPAAKFDPGNTVDGVLDDDVTGFGWFPEAEAPAELGENQKLGQRDGGTLDTEQNLFVYARAAVDLTQAEIDARESAADAAAAQALSDARAAKWASIKARRDETIFSQTALTVTVGGRSWPVDLRDLQDYVTISGLVQTANLLSGQSPAPTFLFTDANNVDQELSVSEVVGMGLQVSAFWADTHAYTQRLRPIVFDESVTDPATINAITWEDGAPPSPE